MSDIDFYSDVSESMEKSGLKSALDAQTDIQEERNQKLPPFTPSPVTELMIFGKESSEQSPSLTSFPVPNPLAHAEKTKPGSHNQTPLESSWNGTGEY